ncbi:MAG: hypothetical protein AB7I19_13125 [Planctomycetota bacterium]
MVRNLTRALPSLVAILAACTNTSSPHAATTRSDVDRVLDLLYGDRRSASQTATVMEHSPWRLAQVFTVVNYTWPHTPGAIVALDGDGRALPISGLTDGMNDMSAPESFNALARAERNAISPEAIVLYLRFALHCTTGVPLDGSTTQVGLLEETLETTATEAHLVGTLPIPKGAGIPVDVELRLADGTLEFRQPRALGPKPR